MMNALLHPTLALVDAAKRLVGAIAAAVLFVSGAWAIRIAAGAAANSELADAVDNVTRLLVMAYNVL